MRIVQYTVNIGNYDHPRNDILSLDGYNLFKNDARNSRAAKILSHKFIDADVSIYWDANQFLKGNITPEQFVNKFLGDKDIALMKCSTGKDCVYQEIEAAIRRLSREGSNFETEILEQQRDYYKSIGFPEHCNTLSSFQPLIRRHTKEIERFNEAWWAEMCRWSYRDQVSLPVILAQFPNLKINWVSFDGLTIKTKHK